MTRLSRMDFDWRPPRRTPYTLMPDLARRVRQPPDALPVFYLCYRCNPW
jgi:hypothetical protein